MARRLPGHLLHLEVQPAAVKIVRYFFVGGTAAAVDLLLFGLLTLVLGVHWFYAAAISFVPATAVNYLLSIRFVFGSQVRFARQSEITLVFAVSAVGLALNELLLWIAIDGLGIPLLVSKVLASGGVFLWNYTLRAHYIFNPSPRSAVRLDDNLGHDCCTEDPRVKATIALLVESLEGGGAERAMLDIGRGLAQRGLDIDLVLIRSTGPYLEDVPDSVRVVALNTRRPLATLLALVKYLLYRRPSLLLSTLTRCNVAALLARVPLAGHLPVIVRRASHFSMDYATRPFRGRVLLAVERALWPFADALVANSSAVAVDLKRIAPRISARVRVIRNPVVWPELSARAAEPVDHPWMSDARVPVVLAAGGLRPVKDHTTLLRAFALVTGERTARLVIIGDGVERDRLSELARELGIASDVDLPGFQRNPFAWMARARVFVMSSIFEGAPNALVQAMACGTTVVSTDCPGGTREILGDGALGALTPVGDHGALAAAISEALDNPLAPSALIGRANDFSADASISAYEEAIGAVLNR